MLKCIQLIKSEQFYNYGGVFMAQRFILNGTSYHGAGAIQEIATEVKSRGFKKAFVCSDPDLVKFGVTAKVLKVLMIMASLMNYIRTSSLIQLLRMYRQV